MMKENKEAANTDQAGGESTQQSETSGESTNKEETSSAITAAELASAINVDTSGTETETASEIVIEKATPKVSKEDGATSDATTTSTTVIKQDDGAVEDVEAPRSLSFNDKDQAMTPSGDVETIDAPKTIERVLSRLAQKDSPRGKQKRKKTTKRKN